MYPVIAAVAEEKETTIGSLGGTMGSRWWHIDRLFPCGAVVSGSTGPVTPGNFVFELTRGPPVTVRVRNRVGMLVPAGFVFTGNPGIYARV